MALANNPGTATVVILGGGSGFGAALAKEFLAAGANVVIAGRQRQRLDEVCASADPARIARIACDVTQADDLDRLWGDSVERFGRIDHWLNNAGIGIPTRDLTATTPKDIERIVSINLVGALLGARCAMQGMLAQGHGHIWITEGLGSAGPVLKGTSAYSASKAGATQAFRVLVKEAAGTGVRVGYMRPGFMPTGLSKEDGAVPDKDVDRMINMIGDRPEWIAPWFVRRILANPPNGKHLTWLPPAKIVFRLITAPLTRRQVV
ncbi:MAG TPA: SDR family oxidoreductase [Vicinamibacterales bacterium]|nr:SDR family oxidoreductase [Vicinamibacterales bacterium]